MGIKYFFKWFKTNHSESITCIDRRRTNVPIDVLLIDMNGIIHNSAQKVYGYGSFSVAEEGASNKKVYALVCLTIDKMVRQFKPKELVLCIDGVAPMSKQIQQRQRRFLAAHDRRAPGTAFDFDSNKGNTSLFDSNAISPGTEFMHDLGRYIDTHIKMKQKRPHTTESRGESRPAHDTNWRTSINGNVPRQLGGGQRNYSTQQWQTVRYGAPNPMGSWDRADNDWSNMTVIFANDKVAGEGEHKLLNYIRKYGNHDWTYCIYGSDADLIMLSMSALTTSVINNIFVLRDEYKSPNYLLIDIPFFVDSLVRDVRNKAHKDGNVWNGEFNRQRFINDFIFMCFMVGNDFLPHIPTIEIMSNGIESMLDFYVKHNKHITNMVGNGVVFDHKALLPILKDLENLEQSLCDLKVNDIAYFRDELLENCSKMGIDGLRTVDMKEYRKKYTNKHFAVDDTKDNGGGFEASVMYLEGMQWVLSYYTCKVPSWSWSYRYDYAPNLTNIIEALSFKKKRTKVQKSSSNDSLPSHKKSIQLSPVATAVCVKQSEDTFVNGFNSMSISQEKPMFEIPTPTEAIPPFHQLLFILPPDSSDLLPYPLNKAFFNELKVYAPKELIIDRSGKRQEWEGIVLLPKLDQKVVSECYLKYKPYVTNKKDLARDIKGRTFRYRNGDASFLN
jgi:5'-3' exonuclease